LQERIENVFKKCRGAGITLSRKKAKIGTRMKFAGFVVQEGGVMPDPEKVKAISDFPVPKNVTDLKSILGLAVQLATICHT